MDTKQITNVELLNIINGGGNTNNQQVKKIDKLVNVLIDMISHKDNFYNERYKNYTISIMDEINDYLLYKDTENKYRQSIIYKKLIKTIREQLPIRKSELNEPKNNWNSIIYSNIYSSISENIKLCELSKDLPPNFNYN